MAKRSKNNQMDIRPVPREAIAAVQGEEDFVELLRRELEWPIPINVERLADVAMPHDLTRAFLSRIAICLPLRLLTPYYLLPTDFPLCVTAVSARDRFLAFFCPFSYHGFQVFGPGGCIAFDPETALRSRRRETRRPYIEHVQSSISLFMGYGALPFFFVSGL